MSRACAARRSPSSPGSAPTPGLGRHDRPGRPAPALDRSERFRTLWARQDVKHKAPGTSLFNHPQVGPLELNYERLLIAGSGMLALVTYHAQPGSDSEERLRLLDSITTTGPATPVRPRPPLTTRSRSIS